MKSHEKLCITIIFTMVKCILSTLLSLSVVDAELEQIDFIDSCTGDDDEEDGRSRRRAEPVSLSSQFMAYIERRITREVCISI